MSTREQILSILSREGPMLPVEISSKVGLDSFLIKGFLDDLLREGKIRVSNQRVGSDFIFYLPGQEEALNKKYEESREAIIRVKNYRDRQIQETPELLKKREEFIQRLRAIETREKEEIKPEPPKVETKKSFFKFREQPVEEKPVEVKHEKHEHRVSFVQKAEKFLEESGINIIEKKYEKKKSEELLVSVPSRLYPITHLAVIKDKKKINRSDLALAYTKSLELKMPVLFLTPGDLTKEGQKYIEEVGEFLKIKTIK